MSDSFTLPVEPARLPELPALLVKSMKSSLIKALMRLKTGGIHLTEPDGSALALGNTGKSAWRVQVLDDRFYVYAAFGGSLGIGEAWILGLWNSPDLVQATQLLIRERDVLTAIDDSLISKARMPIYKWIERRRQNTKSGSRRNIHAHYDLGNDFFKLFLDDSMTYSSAVFANEAVSLSDAQFEKYDLICRKLDLQADDQVLEIGSGWGGLSMHAAKHFGARVVTTTISDEQYELASRRIREAGLDDRITIVKKDYRDLQGQFDKLISIEMIEAVGHKYLPTYFKQIQNLLQPDGQALIQAITIQDQFYDRMRKGTDFIREHIFPGGLLPSVNQVLSVTTADTDLRLFHLEDFGRDYARTLAEWRRAFHQHLPNIRAMGYSQEFCRMWDFYLASCEAGFLETSTSVVHLHFTRPGCRRERYSFNKDALNTEV